MKSKCCDVAVETRILEQVTKTAVDYFRQNQPVYTENELAQALQDQTGGYIAEVEKLTTRQNVIDGYSLTAPLVYREEVLDILKGKTK